MRLSQSFTKTIKQVSADETSKNAELLTRAGFIDKLMSGVYTYLHLGLRTLNKIKDIIREEMANIGAEEILMPALTPKENWEKTGRQDMDILFKAKSVSDHEYILGATHEEVVTPLVQKFVKSYRDLPVAVFQIQDKFRHEPRAKSGILRGREFSMKDLYSFHIDEKEFKEYYEKATEAYFKIYNRLGLGGKTLLTYASGGVFSKYSHEFQTLSEVGEDEIHVCEKCQVAINQEIIDDIKTCPKCGSDKLVVKKSIEVGNIFELKNKYTKAFNFTCPDESGTPQEVIMGCYGMGPSRVMGTIVEVFHDDKGMIWPKEVAPYQVHLLFVGNDDEAKKATEQLYNLMTEAGIEVLFDDREAGAGEKLNDADLIGLPYRVLVSAKTLDKKSVELKLRQESEVSLVKFEDIIDKLR